MFSSLESIDDIKFKFKKEVWNRVKIKPGKQKKSKIRNNKS
jgi:hypothetical protein